LEIFTEKQPSASVKPDNHASFKVGSKQVSRYLGNTLQLNEEKSNLIALVNEIFHFFN